jgi:hypothetical protein
VTRWNQNGVPIYFANTSVPKSDPVHVQGRQAIEQALVVQINASHVVVAPAGLYASHSYWIDFELAVSKQLGVPVVQVNPRSQERFSLIVKQAADHEVNWNARSVVTAILTAAR